MIEKVTESEAACTVFPLSQTVPAGHVASPKEEGGGNEA